MNTQNARELVRLKKSLPSPYYPAGYYPGSGRRNHRCNYGHLGQNWAA